MVSRHRWVDRARGLGSVLLLLAMTAVACRGDGGGATSEMAQAPDLDDRTFVSTSVSGHRMVPDTEVRLSFSSRGLTAEAGCNEMFGRASWETGRLVLANELGETLMLCPPERQAQDDWLLSLLASSPPLVLDGDLLRVGDAVSGLEMREE